MDSILVLSTIIPTLILTVGGLFYKTKCSSVNVLWGCFSFARNVDDETKIDMNESQNQKV